MKTITLRILCLFAFFIAVKAHSQVKIGDNVKNINPNSLLELESTTKGFLLPRLTSNQIKTMTNVPTGMMLFSSTDSVVYIRKDTGWAILSFVVPKTDKNWANIGTDIYNTNTGNVGIGTNVPTAKLQVADSSVVFSADGDAPGFAPNPPQQGAGRRLMWYSGEGAFRAGRVSGTDWDKDSIGQYSIALGNDVKAKGFSSFAAGGGASATGDFSVALGAGTAAGRASVALLGGKANEAYSLAMGYNSTANNTYSLATGYNTTANGYSSTATGSSTVANGNYSFTSGADDSASGQFSTAMGQGTIATGNWATAIGHVSSAKGSVATAMGEVTTASGDFSTAMGARTVASGTYSTATGIYTTAAGIAATAMGNATTASGAYATSAGFGTIAPSFSEIAVGSYNTRYTGYDYAGWQATDRAFTIGNGKSPDQTSDALVVLKSGNTGIGNSMPANKLSVTSNDDGYIASFQNTNASSGGDGIKIKLGKTHPMWNGSGYYNVTLPNAQIIQDQIDEVKGLIQSHGKNFSVTDILNLTPLALYAGTTVQITNLITKKLNTSLDLPAYSPSTTIDTHIPEITKGDYKISFGKLGSFDIPIPEFQSNTYNIDIPKFEVFPSIPQIPTDGLPQFTFPNIPTSFPTDVLNSSNQFLNFSDKDDRQLGSVIAEAPKDWLSNYLDPATITGIIAYVGGIDFAKDFLGLLASATQITENFNQIGVEYTSGHGDYAEWLERQDKDEFISAGDIVAVKGGKITKDVKGAEQVMVVSHKPVVLGNTPPEGKEGNGNKVAFMGQVPVKIIGPVNSGDYILAEGNIPGYGVAKNPSKMTALDFKLSVGRSWSQNLSDGPKMVNTLIGVDNGDYLKILQHNQEQINETNKKVDEITKRLLLLEKALSTKVKSTLSNFSKN